MILKIVPLFQTGLSKILLLSILLTLLSNCTMTNKLSYGKQMAKGTIEKKPYVNKKGAVSNTIFDYFFVPSKEEKYLISISQSNYAREELDKYVGKQVEVDCELTNGAESVDSSIEVQVQSRITDYIIIFKIK